MARLPRQLTVPLPPLPGEVPAVMIGVAASTFLCVPETDQMDEVAVALGVVLVLERYARRPFGWAVGVIQAGVVLAAGLYGATGRDSATVGAWFSFWPFAITALVIAATIRCGPRFRIGAARRTAIEFTGFVAAVTVARTGALAPSAGPAFASAAAAALASTVVALCIGFWRRPPASGC